MASMALWACLVLLSVWSLRSFFYTRGNRGSSGNVTTTSTVLPGDNDAYDPAKWYRRQAGTTPSKHNAFNFARKQHGLEACYKERDAILGIGNRSRAMAPMSVFDLDARMSRLQPCLAQSHLDIFWAMWFTPAATWGPRQELFLQSLFVHHPDACMIIIAYDDDRERGPDTWEAIIGASAVRLGYCLSIVRIDCAGLISSNWWLSVSNEAWLKRLAKARCHINASGNMTSKDGEGAEAPASTSVPRAQDYPYLASHLSDYLRFYLLFKYGGTYVDTDTIFVQQLPLHISEFYGLDRSPRSLEEWFLDARGRRYAAPGVMRTHASNPAMRMALETAFDPALYDPKCFNCIGPRALNLALKARSCETERRRQRQPTASAIPVMSEDAASFGDNVGGTSPTYFPTRYLYLLPYTRAAALFKPDAPTAPLFVQHLQRFSYALHLFGKASAAQTVGRNSVVDLLMSRQRLTRGGRGANDGRRRNQPTQSDQGDSSHRDPRSSTRTDDKTQGGSSKRAEMNDPKPAARMHFELVAPSIAVVRGNFTQFAGPHAVFIRETAAGGSIDRSPSSATLLHAYFSVEISAAWGTIQAPSGGSGDGVSSSSSTSAAAKLSDASSLREVNAWLAQCMYHVPTDDVATNDDVITVSFRALDGRCHRPATTNGARSSLGSCKAEAWTVSFKTAVFHRLVTVIAHGSPKRVRALHSSVQEWFPGTTVIAFSPLHSIDAGAHSNSHRSQKQLLRWWQPPADVGADAAGSDADADADAEVAPFDARTATFMMMRAAETPFVQLLGDGDNHAAMLSVRLHLDILLERLLTNDGVAIASGTTLAVEDRPYSTEPTGGRNGYVDGCRRVQRASSVCMARREETLAIIETGDSAPWLGTADEHPSSAFELGPQQTWGIGMISCSMGGANHEDGKANSPPLLKGFPCAEPTAGAV